MLIFGALTEVFGREKTTPYASFLHWAALLDWHCYSAVRIILTFFTECDRPVNPAHGRFDCTSNQYKESSTCYLICDPGYIQASVLSMTCKALNTPHTFGWDTPINLFSCVKACHLLTGGIQNGTKWVEPSLNEVNVSSGKGCSTEVEHMASH